MAVNNSTSNVFFRMLAATAFFVAVIGGILAWSFFGGISDNRIIGLVGLGLCAVGLIVLGIVALIEIGPIASALSTSRGAVGGNAVLQILVATILIVAVNVFSAGHYVRCDWTRHHDFTLPPSVAGQMAQLRDDTDIYVVEKHVTFGQRGGEQPDRYDLAASKKIIEKVKDLALLFQDAGSQFHVHVLDIQDENFGDAVKALRKKEKAAAEKRGEPEKSPLADAIEAAPESSIFFHTRGKVQRLAFHDVYSVDKEKSKDNLVLNFQGVEPLARKIFGIEEKKPRVTLAVVHPALSMTSRDHPLLTMNGAKKALESQGFICNDILLRKQESEGGLSQEAAAQSFDESRFEQIEEELSILDEVLRKSERNLPIVREMLDLWKGPLSEVNKKFAYVRLPNGQQGVVPHDTLKQLTEKKVKYESVDVDEEDRNNNLRIYNREVAAYEQEIEAAKKEKSTLETEQKGLNVDELAERKRIADVESKMKQLLANTDLLILPRFTFHHLPTEQIISNKVHKLDDAQLRALKYLIKAGKPVMFLLGPVNEKREMPADFGGGDDRLEPMLAELGILLPKQTILYAAETKEFNERKAGLGFSIKELELPAALVNWPYGAGEVGRYKGPGNINPIRESLSLTSLSVGKQLSKELQIRHPRPVYPLLPGDVGKTSAAVFDESGVFLMTDDDTWNENSPFVNEKREVPRYQPSKDDDPKKGTLEEVRRGPFPIGVAVERKIPADWYDDKTTPPAKTRLAVLGNGGVFVGQTISPIKEKLLLDVSNWLLGRDDLLAHSEGTWSFPRVDLGPEAFNLWLLAMQFGLPLLFAYLGVLVWFVRRMR